MALLAGACSAQRSADGSYRTVSALHATQCPPLHATQRQVAIVATWFWHERNQLKREAHRGRLERWRVIIDERCVESMPKRSLHTCTAQEPP